MTKAERTLSRWGLVVAWSKGPYLAGHENGLMRVSTALVSFDPVKLIGTTASGRPYRLSGPADSDYALQCATTLWGRVYNIADAGIRIVDPLHASWLIYALDNAPLNKSQDELARERGIRLQMAGMDIRRQALLAGLDDEEAAAAIGMDVARFRSLASGEGEATDLTVEEAESALSVIAARASSRLP